MKRRDYTRILAAQMIRCSGCLGHIGKRYTDRSKPCFMCAGIGWVHRTTGRPVLAVDQDVKR